MHDSSVMDMYLFIKDVFHCTCKCSLERYYKSRQIARNLFIEAHPITDIGQQRRLAAIQERRSTKHNHSHPTGVTSGNFNVC